MSEFELFCKEESAEIFFCGYPKLLEVHPKYCEKKLKGRKIFLSPYIYARLCVGQSDTNAKKIH